MTGGSEEAKRIGIKSAGKGIFGRMANAFRTGANLQRKMVRATPEASHSGPPMAFVRLLDDVTLHDRETVGNKAANLGTLIHAGIPVPPGFCIPWRALGGPAESLWAEIEQAYRCLSPGGEPVAVRSSGTAEDSRNASFAGQYETILNVCNLEALRKAIRDCWKSGRSGRVLSYLSHCINQGGRVSVLVQQQVPADLSGVLFTSDPVSGSDRFTLIEATQGLGDRLVAGRIAAKTYFIENHGAKMTSPQGGLLSRETSQALSRLGAQIERILGRGQDIEWAIHEGKIYVLQARPITSIKCAPTDNPVWTRANVGEVLPGPVTPLTWSVFRATLEDRPLEPSLTDAHEGEEQNVRRIEGKVHIRLERFLDAFCYLPYVTPEIMSRVLGIPLVRGMTYFKPKGIRVRLAQFLFLLESFDLLTRTSRRIQRIRRHPQAKERSLDALISWNGRCFRYHLECSAYAVGTFALISAFLSRCRVKEAFAALHRVLNGRERMQSSEQGVALWKMAEYVRTNPGLRETVMGDFSWDEMSELLLRTESGSRFRKMFQDFLEIHGERAVGEFELAVPRWKEDPSFPMGVLRRFLCMDPAESPSVQLWAGERSYREATDYISKRLNFVQRVILRRLLNSHRRFTVGRENLKFELMRGYALLRDLFLDLGRDLAEKRRLRSAGDIFFLSPHEITMLKEEENAVLSAMVSARQEEYARYLNRVPAGFLPPNGPGVPQARGSGLEGIGCSPGSAEGLARVLMDISDSRMLRPGEILVTPHTDPGWTPLFLGCSAIVTELGGFLSHGATVAREYGLPAVFGVVGATTKIRTGELIRVDGTAGVVTIMDAQERT